jgi:hypothetical protein
MKWRLVLRGALVMSLLSLAACGGGGASAEGDAAFDAVSAADTGGGAGHDASADAPGGGTVDAPAEAASDAPGDRPIDAPSEAAMDAGDGGVPCVQTFTGDENSTLTCSFSLCHPATATYELLDVSSSSHVLRPGVDGTFAAGTYTDATLSTHSTFDVTTASGATYSAGGGADALAGQQIHLVLDSVQPPSTGPCDGVAHGTLDVTLVQIAADGGVAAGRIVAHVTF